MPCAFGISLGNTFSAKHVAQEGCGAEQGSVKALSWGSQRPGVHARLTLLSLAALSQHSVFPHASWGWSYSVCFASAHAYAYVNLAWDVLSAFLNMDELLSGAGS